MRFLIRSLLKKGSFSSTEMNARAREPALRKWKVKFYAARMVALSLW